MRLSRLAPALGALALAACSDSAASRPPPTDRFYYPTSLAVRHLDAAGQDCTGGAPGCTTQLLVVSSNFDLAYDLELGGTLLSVAVPADPGAADPLPAVIPDLPVRGAVRLGSLAGTMAVVEEATCPGWSSGGTARPSIAAVTSRIDDALYRVDLAGDLSLGCDGALTGSLGLVPCRLALDDSTGNPFGLGLACRGTGSAFQARSYVGFLDAVNGDATLERVDLACEGWRTGTAAQCAGSFSLASPSPANLFDYDRARDRLWFTGRFAVESGQILAPFRFLELGNPVATPGGADLSSPVPGSETSGFSLSSDRSRAYVGLRLYDAGAALRTSARPFDSGGALGVLDLREGADGAPLPVVLAAVPVGRSPGEVKVIPRPGRRDLVVVSCLGDDSVWLYDDQTGTVAKVFGRDSSGRPALGAMPYALAVEPRLGGAWRIYVAAFDSSEVTVIDVPDPNNPHAARLLMRLGRARP